jgi:hypothetical protein
MTTAAVATSTDMTAATVTAATTAAMSTTTATTVGAAAATAMTATTTTAATTMTSGKANRTFFVEDMESRQTNVGDFFFGHKDVGRPHFGIGIGGPHTGARRARQCHQADPDCGDDLATTLLFRLRGLLHVFLLLRVMYPDHAWQEFAYHADTKWRPLY